MRERVVYVGQSVAVLEWLCARPDVELVTAFCPPDALMSSALLTCALHWGVELVWASDSEAVERAMPPAVDLGVCAYFRRLAPSLLSAPRLGWLNLHPAPLPERPGKLPTVEGVLEGDTMWGVSLHWMSEALDAGDLIEVKRCARSWSDGPVELERRAMTLGLQLLSEHWEGITGGYAPREPQPKRPSHRAPHYRQGLDLTRPSLELWRQLKAYEPFGGVPMRLSSHLVLLTRGELTPQAQPPRAPLRRLKRSARSPEPYALDVELMISAPNVATCSLTSEALKGAWHPSLKGAWHPLEEVLKGAWHPLDEGAWHPLTSLLSSSEPITLERLTPQEERLFLFELSEHNAQPPKRSR